MDYLVDSSDPESKEFVAIESLLAPIKSEDDVSNYDSPKQYDGHNHFCAGFMWNKEFLSSLIRERWALMILSEQTSWHRWIIQLLRLLDGLIATLMSIYLKEMCMVLKSYGQGCAYQTEENFLPEIYFDCARFCPWEFIYYRRLKKGSISKEYLAHRLSQNGELDNVDNTSEAAVDWQNWLIKIRYLFLRKWIHCYSFAAHVFKLLCW